MYLSDEDLSSGTGLPPGRLSSSRVRVVTEPSENAARPRSKVASSTMDVDLLLAARRMAFASRTGSTIGPLVDRWTGTRLSCSGNHSLNSRWPPHAVVSAWCPLARDASNELPKFSSECNVGDTKTC